MSKSSQRPRTGASTLMVVVLLVVVTIITAFAIPSLRQAILSAIGFGSDGKDTRYVTHVARKAPFRIVISENGTVDSMRNSTLFNSVEGSTTIISLVPEGSPVQGPVVADMDGTVKILEQSSGSTAKLKVVRDMDSATAEEGDAEKEYDVSFGPYTRLLVTDGQKVRKGDYLAGDVVCELDSSSMVEAERQQQIALTEAQANYEKADKNLQIQESTNESLLAQAKLAEELAQLDFQMYTAKDGEYEQALETIQGELKQLEEDLAMAQEEYDYTKRVARRGYKTQNDLEAARVRVTQKQILLNVKQGALTVLERFTKDRTVKELEQTATDSKRETLRVQLEGEAAMAQMRADFTARKLTLAVEEEKLARLERQIDGCLLIPPQAGQVVYASQSSRRSEPVVIEEGATVRERQAVINLPDLTQMKIDARIHESRINRIALGQRVEVRVDAQPDEIYVGKLKSVSSVPSSGSWPNTDLKEYEAVVEITDSIDRVKTLKPGMTASVDIIVADRAEDVLQIPVQAVLALGNKFFTYVVENKKKAELTEIKIGDANAEYMEILEGITEGDTVVMNPRSHFAEEISSVETKILAEIEQGRERTDTGTQPAASPGGGPGGGKPGAGGPGAGGPGAGGRPAAGGPGGGDPMAFFKTMDKNSDGVITSEEVPRPEMLERMDGDGDGKVTEEEFRKAAASFSGGGGGRPGGGGE